MKDSVDVRYAQALFSVAIESGNLKLIHKEIKELYSLFESNADILKLFKSEFLTLEKRYSTLDKILKNYSKEVINFIKVLIKNHRLNSYRSIFKTFNSLCNEYKKIKEGIVYSTYKLDEKDILKIEESLCKKLNHKVDLLNKIDPSLIGGIKIVIDNQIYDYSIKNELNMLRDKLKK